MENPKYIKFKSSLKVYKKRIEQEIYDQCIQIVGIVGLCMMKAVTDESKTFFLKMKGDFYRYVAECATDEQLK